nr:endonuclease/exonuclease/phosphatase family protein [Angustibacter aerolatus]
MLRVVTANVNGVRAASRRGGLAWLSAQQPDVLCLQEVRADDAQAARGARRRRLRPLVRRAHREPHPGPGRRRRRHPRRAARRPHRPHASDGGRRALGRGRPRRPRSHGDGGLGVRPHRRGGHAPAGREGALPAGDVAPDDRAAPRPGRAGAGHRRPERRPPRGRSAQPGAATCAAAGSCRPSGRCSTGGSGRAADGSTCPARSPATGPARTPGGRGAAGRSTTTPAGGSTTRLATRPLAALARRAEVGRAATYAERWSDHAAVVVDYDL